MKENWEVEFTKDFESWFNSLTDTEQDAVDRVLYLLESEGPNLGFPYSSGISSSKFSHMRELRVVKNGIRKVSLLQINYMSNIYKI